MRLFFDFEFTSLVPNTTPISVGVVADNGKSFYAEFTDYNRDLVDDWIQENVIDNLLFSELKSDIWITGDYFYMKGTRQEVSSAFIKWLDQFNHVEFWGDTLSYDGVLLNDLMGGALSIPSNVDYIFYDIATYMKILGVDPDISREAFIDRPIGGDKHNSLFDARVIQACYEKLQRNKEDYIKSLS
jgi:hypothetical protein